MKSKKAKRLLWINLKLCFILILSTYSINSQQIDSILQKAYRYNSDIILDEFFMNWEHDSKLTDSERQYINQRIDADDTLREVYELAKKFYLPVYPESKYFLIEDTLKYQVCYAETNDSCTPTFDYSRTSKYFYPLKFDTDDPRILYLNSKYNQILTEYFKNSENDIYKRGEIYEAKRKIFENKIKFYSVKLMGVKPESFHKTHILVPEIWDIVISKDLDKALLTYTTYNYMSFEKALWEKKNGIWEFIKIVGQGGY